jgi:hypothetical protein
MVGIARGTLTDRLACSRHERTSQMTIVTIAYEIHYIA